MRPEKISILQDLRDRIASSKFAYLADFSGMTVAKVTELRRLLGAAQARYSVVSNRLFRLVARERGLEALEPALKGPTAMIAGSGDPAATAKVIKDFVKANQRPVVKMGVMDGAVLSAAQVDALASLPPRKVLQGMFVGTLAAPMSSLVGVMNQKVASLVYVLKAVQESKEKPAA